MTGKSSNGKQFSERLVHVNTDKSIRPLGLSDNSTRKDTSLLMKSHLKSTTRVQVTEEKDVLANLYQSGSRVPELPMKSSGILKKPNLGTVLEVGSKAASSADKIRSRYEILQLLERAPDAKDIHVDGDEVLANSGDPEVTHHKSEFFSCVEDIRGHSVANLRF